MIIKKIAFATLTILSLNIFAQTEKGNFFLGVGSSISSSITNNYIKSDGSSKTKIGTSRYFSINPRIGYFIVDSFLVGAQLNLSYGSYEDSSNSTSKNTNLAIAPILRYYFLDGEFKPFLNAIYGIETSINEFTEFDGSLSEFRLRGSNLALGAGISYFFNKNISIELGLNYLRRTNKRVENNNDDTRNITSGVGSTIGFAIFL